MPSISPVEGIELVQVGDRIQGRKVGSPRTMRLSKLDPVYIGIDTRIKKFDVILSSKIEDIRDAANGCGGKWRSCLSEGGCNDDTVQSLIETRTVVVMVLDEKNSCVGRCWLRWNGRTKFWMENRWYSDNSFCPQEANDITIEFLKKYKMFTNKPMLPSYAYGWSDRLGGRVEGREDYLQYEEEAKEVELEWEMPFIYRGIMAWGWSGMEVFDVSNYYKLYPIREKMSIPSKYNDGYEDESY